MSTVANIDYIELKVKDMKAARKFYAAAFGWEFNDYGPEYSGIKSEVGEAGGLMLDEKYKGVRGGPLVVLHAEDLDAVVARVKKAKGKITTKPFEFPGGRRFHFTDPSGNELAVWSKG